MNKIIDFIILCYKKVKWIMEKFGILIGIIIGASVTVLTMILFSKQTNKKVKKQIKDNEDVIEKIDKEVDKNEKFIKNAHGRLDNIISGKKYKRTKHIYKY